MDEPAAADLVEHLARTLDGTYIERLRVIVEVDQYTDGTIMVALRTHDPITDTISDQRHPFTITIDPGPPPSPDPSDPR